MSYNETGTHKKCRIAHPWVFRGTASAPFVPAQDLRAHGNSLSPQPQASVNRGPCPNHRPVTEAPCVCNCKVTGHQQHWVFNRYFVGVSARQQPHPYGRSVGNTGSMSLSARTAGGHSLEERILFFPQDILYSILLF